MGSVLAKLVGRRRMLRCVDQVGCGVTYGSAHTSMDRARRHSGDLSMNTSLAGKVALVAGATRGAGRGIAVQLGAAGATVYVTDARPRVIVGDEPPRNDRGDRCAGRSGGRLGIAVQVDHLVPMTSVRWSRASSASRARSHPRERHLRRRRWSGTRRSGSPTWSTGSTCCVLASTRTRSPATSFR